MVLVFCLILLFLLSLKFSPLLFLVFIPYVASDKSLLILMIPFLRFLSALLFSTDLITATLCTIIFLNLPFSFLLKLPTLLHAWSLISYRSSLATSSFSLSSKSVISCIKSHATSPFFIFNLLIPFKRAGLRSSTRSQLFIISPSHSYAKTAFSFSGPLLWNSLSSNLKSSPYPIFLKNLKTYFLNLS